MKLTILLLTALAAFGQQVCITNPQGTTKCRAITADAWNAAQDFRQASCKTDDKGVTTCTYKSAADVIFQHIAGYLVDLQSKHPQPTLRGYLESVAVAESAVKAEAAKPPLGTEQ